jgi:hypothetical protein
VSDVLTFAPLRTAPKPPSAQTVSPQPAPVAPRPTPVALRPTLEAPQPASTVAQESLTALTERSVRQRLVDEFGKAFIDAIELSKTMVAEDEAAPINDQTYFYAFSVLAPFIIDMELPVPLILPLQNGGIGAEWHDHGMNIELRFRNPYHIYAVLEDARGVIPPLHGRDLHLVQARTALRELATRAVR